MSVAENIKKIAKARDFSIKRLSREINMPYHTFYNEVRRGSTFKPDTLIAVAEVLNCDVNAFFEDTIADEIVMRPFKSSKKIPDKIKQDEDLQIETELGTLIVDLKDSDLWSSIIVSLKLKSGEVLPLSNTAITKRCKDIVMELWQNPDSDIPEYRYLFPKEKLFPNQSKPIRKESDSNE